MKRVYVQIEGIHCAHCIEAIQNGFLNHKKVKNITIRGNVATVDFVGKFSKKEIIHLVEEIGYLTDEDKISENLKDIDPTIKGYEFLLIFGSVLLLWYGIQKLFGFNIFNVIPSIDNTITYGMLFVTGLFTSIHCISMCGAINLVAVVSSKRGLKRPILYNLGRVLSYTLVGGICGAIGSVLAIHQVVSGILILLAAIVMFLMSLSMLGILPIRFSFFSKFRISHRSENSFVIGLLNGLMPCGPLQAMQLYALSTGSFLLGALSMFLFSLGTVPLMLTVGFVFNLFKGKKKILFQKIAAVLILILSFTMLHRGLLSFSIDFSKVFKNYGDFTSSQLIEDYQVIEFDLDYSSYEDIIVQKDIPVKMIIHVDSNHLTGCNGEVILPDFGARKKLEVGDNVIEFFPSKEGIYTYTCWMNMIENHIKVIDDIRYFEVK